MDASPEELRSLGFFGIFRESFKIIFSWPSLFLKITLVLILPLSVLFLEQIHVANLLFSQIDGDTFALSFVSSRSMQSVLSNRIRSKVLVLVLFHVAYVVAVLVFALLATSAVVYTVACAYTAKDMTFCKVMRVVPNVWRRIIVTFLWTILLLLAYHAAALLLVIVSAVLVSVTDNASPGVVLVAAMAMVGMLAGYVAGVVYINVVWHIASVVSVMEESYGVAAMRKSRALVRGKVAVAAWVYVAFYLSFATVEGAWRLVVSREWEATAADKAGCAVLFLVLMSLLQLVGLAVMTVGYFVCKVSHGEDVDKGSLSQLLEDYLGYRPLMS